MKVLWQIVGAIVALALVGAFVLIFLGALGIPMRALFN